MHWTNYHQHSHYDDGTRPIEEHVQSAVAQGVISMGFSGHSPVAFANNWSMKKEDLPSYFEEIDLARKKYSSTVELYKGLEVDYIPGQLTVDTHWLKALDLDYTIGSVHFVGAYDDGTPWEIDGPHHKFLKGLHEIYHEDVRYVIQRYFALTRQMVREACPDIIGHIDKIKMQNRGFWNEVDDWYQQELLQTLEEIRGKDAIIEVNTRGIYKKLTSDPYPGRWLLERIYEMNIPIQLNSAAHHPREITSNFQTVAALLVDIGFKKMSILQNHQWTELTFDENGLKIS
jgi:histidinol-phosphatase (PHP family)